MVHRLQNPAADATRLSQSVLQIAEFLNLLRAELARILGMQCADINALAGGRQLLKKDSAAWQQALLLVRFYDLLYQSTQGDAVDMCHWLRARHPGLSREPFYLMVDDHGLQQVVDYLADRVI